MSIPIEESDDRVERTAPVLRPLSSVAIFWAVVGMAYGLTGSRESGAIIAASYLSLLGAGGMWLRSDAPSSGVRFVFDWGLFAFVAWPLLLPIYAYRTRGFNGWRLTAQIFGAMFALQLGILVGGVDRILLGLQS